MNTEQHSLQTWDDEIDLREYIEILWRGKWIIISMVLIAALVAWFGGHIFLSPTYDATATLLIMPPTYQTSIEPKPLALEIYRDLALTPAIATQVIEKLNLTDQDGGRLPATALLDRVNIEVSTPEQNRRGTEQVASVLKLKVSWSNPVKARDIANTWAEIFMENASNIRKSESDEVARVILQQFDATQQALQEAENELLEFQSANPIHLIRQNVELLREQLSQRREHFLGLQRELEMKHHQLTTLQMQLADLEEDGEWVGLRTRNVADIDDKGIPARRQAINAAMQYIEAEKALQDFDNSAELTLIEQELELERTRLANYRKELAQLQATEPQLAIRSEILTKTLANQEPKLVMSRSITNDALWLSVSAGTDSIDELARLTLEDESPNPNYEYIEKQLIDTQVELTTIPSRIQAYQTLVADSAQRVKELEATLRALQQRRQALQDQLALSEQLYKSLQTEYSNLRNQCSSLVLEVTRLEAELASARQSLEEYEATVSQAEKQLLTLELKEERLNHNTQVLKQTYTELAGQAEAARLLELQAREDVRFISPAIAPSTPSGPNHKLNVAIAVFLAGMVGIAVVFLLNMMQASSTRSSQAV